MSSAFFKVIVKFKPSKGQKLTFYVQNVCGINKKDVEYRKEVFPLNLTF